MLRIAEARMARGLSQKDLAVLLGTSQQTVQRWESGVTDPKIGQIQAVSAALGVTVSYLLGLSSSDVNDGATGDERELLDLFRLCSDYGRECIMQVARTTAKLFGRELS